MRRAPLILTRWWSRRRRPPRRADGAVAADVREERRVLERWARRAQASGRGS